MKLSDIISVIKEAEKIAILPHISADGDALGSCMGLGLALEGTGKQIDIYLEESIPEVYGFLPGQHMVMIYNGMQKKYDAVIVLDTGDLGRLGKRVEILESCPVTVNVDHHATNTEFAVHNFVQTTSAAVGEIVYDMLEIAGIKLDRDIATCLYVAISTDTGGFRYSNTTQRTHSIVGNLVNTGLDIGGVSQLIFDSYSYEKIKLLGFALNTLELFENGRIALIRITDEAMNKLGAKEEDCDGIVNFGRSIRTVEVAVLLREKQNGEIRVNLRSKSYVDVSAIAGMFSGGGHKMAAGCTLYGSINTAGETIIDKIREVL